MSIKDLSKKIKGWGSDSASFPKRLPLLPDDVFLGAIIILVAFGSFGLGRLSKIEGTKTPIRIENAPEVTEDTFGQTTTKESATPFAASRATGQQASLIGSKNGKKYYYPWCSGANRIAEANRIYFASKADAESRGYTPSSMCKGL